MKTKSLAKRVSALALILLLALALAAPLYAVAAGGGAPTNPYWDGHSAVWTEPSGGAPDSYTVRYYKDGSLAGTMTCFGTSLDLNDIMKSKGNGNYSFEVTANYTDGSYSTSSKSGTISFYDTSSGHEHPLAHIDFSYPTCTENGRKEHYECGACGKYFWDEKGQQEITDKSEVVLPAIGHDWGEWQTVKKATATEDGEAKRVCSNDSDHVETKKLPKLGNGETQQSSATEAKTEAVTKAESTTVPETTGKKGSTDPGLKRSDKLISDGSSKAEEEFKNFLGVSTGLFIVIIISAALLFVVAPLVVLLIVLLNRNKKQ